MKKIGGVTPCESKLIKGMALIMMVYHHFFAWPERVLIPSAYIDYSFHGTSIVYFIAKACKLCVCIFAFLSGYGLFYSYSNHIENKEKIQYGIKKMFEMVIVYWSILFVAILIVGISKPIGLSECIKNALLIKTTILHTAWYVRFYLEAMSILLIYVVCVNRQVIWKELFLILLLPCVLYYILPENTFSHYFPTFMLGYIAAKYNLYEKIILRINCIKLTIIAVALLFVLMVIRLKVGDSIGPLAIITFMSMPLVWVMKVVSDYLEKVAIIRKLLITINTYSTYYWLLHSIFHCGLSEIQKIVYLPHYPMLIVGWAFVLMTPFVIVIKKCDACLLGTLEKRTKEK